MGYKGVPLNVMRIVERFLKGIGGVTINEGWEFADLILLRLKRWDLDEKKVLPCLLVTYISF